MKFYIASRVKNVEAVRCLAGKLKAAGWMHTYDWTVDGPAEEVSIDWLKEIGPKEVDGVKDADIVIVLTPQGGGTHTELGMAIALNKKIYICHSDDTYFRCDDNTSPFYWLPQINQFIGAIDDIANELLRNNK